MFLPLHVIVNLSADTKERQSHKTGRVAEHNTNDKCTALVPSVPTEGRFITVFLMLFIPDGRGSIGFCAVQL